MTGPSLSRRRLLGLGSAAGLAAVPALVLGLGSGTDSDSDAGTTSTTMWRLQSDWGFPYGPTGATSCGCNACRAHSANKLFFERADAETSRAHRGCRCVAEPVFLAAPRPILQALSEDGRSIDRRYARHTKDDLRRLT